MMRNSVANRNTHEALLATATSLFNQRGFSATRLVDVADRIGVTQNALYHYVSGKRDLAYQCYLTGCRSRERLLIAAGKRPGLAAIRLFVDKSLSEEEGEMAVMGEVALLTNEQARKVNRETKRSLGALAKMIEAGVSDGSIRKCDPVVAAYSIVSMLDWVPVWFSEKSGDRTALRRTFVDIVTAGVGLKSNSLDDLLDIPFTPALPAAETQVFDRDELGIIKREQILRTTMKMVNRQGVGGVTVDGVAAQLGLSKGAIYYYFRHKNDLIYETFARAHRLGLHCRALATERTTDPLMRYCLFQYLYRLGHGTDDGPIPVLARTTSLQKPVRRQIAQSFSTVRTFADSCLAAAIAQKSMRDIDTECARHAMSGMTNWFAKWYARDGRLTLEQIARLQIDLWARGLSE